MFKAGAAVSLWLMVPPFVFGLVINVSLGLLIAYYRGSWLDRFSTALFIMAMSISYLVYIIALQYFFAFRLGWFPINGYEPGVAGIRYLVLAVADHRDRQHGPGRADVPHDVPGRDPGRLRAHRARQGRERARRAVPPRAQERDDPDRDVHDGRRSRS